MVQEGDVVVLPCHAKSRVTWYIYNEAGNKITIAIYHPSINDYKYFKHLKGRSSVNPENGDLTIQSVRKTPETDENLYMCEAHKSVTKSVMLIISKGKG